MGFIWAELPIIGEVKAVAEYTCGHKGQVTVYVIAGQKATSGVLCASDVCPTCDAKWEEERYERLRKYPEANREQAFDDAVCSSCGGPADSIGCNALRRGEPDKYFDIWDAYCEFCLPYDWHSKRQIQAIRYGVTTFEYWLLCTIEDNQNKETCDLDASVDQLTALLNKAFNPHNDPDEKTFLPEKVQSMLHSLVEKGKLSVADDRIHFLGWGEEWVDYNTRLQKHREMVPAWKKERAMRQPPVTTAEQLEPATDVDPMQEDHREWEFQSFSHQSRGIDLTCGHPWGVPKGTLIVPEQS